MGRRAPPEPTYFLDENLGAREVARLLAEAGLRCVRLADAGSDFATGMTDVHWIELAAARGWWGVTRDGRTLKNPVEREAICRSSAVHIYLRGQHLSIAAMAGAIIAAHRHHRLPARVEARTRPTIVTVQPDGSFSFDLGEKRGGVAR